MRWSNFAWEPINGFYKREKRTGENENSLDLQQPEGGRENLKFHSRWVLSYKHFSYAGCVLARKRPRATIAASQLYARAVVNITQSVTRESSSHESFRNERSSEGDFFDQLD